MFLKTRADGSLLEVLSLKQLADPFAAQVDGRLHAGEELQEQEAFAKADLVFPSGEDLPRCWVDPAYQQG
ncbi:acetyltransferase [Vulcanococcus limneticus]|uniref:acetyltransferase n=1 Tax=Vulcanococcus limneticus TaxID=2170428 RepID=UPI00398BECBC